MVDIARRLDEWAASPLTTKADIRGVKAVMRIAADRIRELEQENAALMPDAERYQFLRNNTASVDWSTERKFDGCTVVARYCRIRADEMDTVIDAARAASKGKKG